MSINWANLNGILAGGEGEEEARGECVHPCTPSGYTYARAIKHKYWYFKYASLYKRTEMHPNSIHLKISSLWLFYLSNQTNNLTSEQSEDHRDNHHMLSA